MEKLAFVHIMRSQPGVVEEYRFCAGRRFRSDFAFPEKKLLVEYEGINSAKSRHTTITGYTKDTEKYNLAAVLGYRVLRYTALNFRNVWKDLEAIFGNDS